MNDTSRPSIRLRARRAVALLALPAAALAAAGCGSDVPPNAVARVGDKVIEKSDFNHWMNAVARAQQQATGGGEPIAPDPPTFARCIAAKQRQPVPRGSRRPAPAQLRTQCRQEYEFLRDQVVQFLIQAAWIEQEAEERDIEVSDAVLNKQFEDRKRQEFRDEKAYRDFLRTSRRNEEDLRYQAKLDALSSEIKKQVVAGQGKITEAQIADYYAKNKAQFAQPERRDLEVVLTKGRDRAERAKAEVRRGTSFVRVAKRHSIDEASKNQGGKLPGVAKGSQLERSLEAATFRAKRNRLVGPIKTQFGYYVLRVTKITPASQQSLAQARETIRSVLRSRQEQKALNDFVKKFRERYRKETNCAKGFVVAGFCKNGPAKEKPPPTPGPPPGGAGGAPQGGAPQGGQSPPGGGR